MEENDLLDPNCPKYKDVFKLSPIAIEMYDTNGIFQEANLACLELFGLKNMEAVAGFNLFADPNLPQNLITQIKAGESAKYELIFDFDLVKAQDLYETTRSGICYLECHIVPTKKEERISGYIVYITEITERKEAGLLLEKQAAELQKLNLTKDKFFSIIAHDLKSPFNAIMGFSELMLVNYDDLDDEIFIKGLKTMESAASHAYKLVENLLIWSKNQSKGKEFNPEWLDLNEHIHDSIKISEGAILNKELHVSFNPKKECSIFADRNMIDLVIRNLISNAIKFTNKKGKISVKVVVNKEEVSVSVSDNGVGIPENKLKTIFEIDKHKNTLGTENEQGTGLGLILCKDFIENHKGKIWVESTQGKGSKFTFTLPLT
jgi:signal transduction histidine kinase